MSVDRAKMLLENARAHGAGALQLFNASHGYAHEIGVPDAEVEKFVFNGGLSLSVFLLIGLALELFLKAAYVASGGEASDEHLRTEIGHDLKKALKKAKELGFDPDALALRQLVSYLDKAYKRHYLRYSRPDGMNLPSDMEQVAAVFELLDNEISALLFAAEEAN